MRLEEKIALIKQLFDMTKADRVIDPSEVNFLYELAVSLELPLEILEDIFDEKPIYLKHVLPKKWHERIIQIYRLALMINIDKHIKFDEVKLLKNIAIELQIPSEPVTLMLTEILKSKTGTLSPEQLFDIFKAINN